MFQRGSRRWSVAPSIAVSAWILCGGLGVSTARARGVSTEQEETIATIRTIAIAIESFGVEEDRYPGPTDGVVDIDYLKKVLVPSYLKRPNWDDGWQRRLRFLSDGTHYTIVSYGKDGKPDVEDWGDGDYDEGTLRERMCGGPVAGAERDIVFMDGQFCQYPE